MMNLGHRRPPDAICKFSELRNKSIVYFCDFIKQNLCLYNMMATDISLFGPRIWTLTTVILVIFAVVMHATGCGWRSGKFLE